MSAPIPVQEGLLQEIHDLQGECVDYRGRIATLEAQNGQLREALKECRVKCLWESFKLYCLLSGFRLKGELKTPAIGLMRVYLTE